MSSARHWLLDARNGPFRAVASFAATADERRAAYPRREALRMLRAIVATGDLRALAVMAGDAPGSPPPSLEPRLREALESGTLLFVPGWTWFRRRTPPADRPIAPPVLPEPGRPTQARKAAFHLTIIDVQTGHPLRGVPLDIDTPDGSTNRFETDGQGDVEIPDLAPGTCTVRSVIEDARVQDSYVPAAPGGSPHEPTGTAPARKALIVDAVPHRTASGQTPASIAKEWGVTWEDIAFFNWGIVDADELEDRYRTTLGCTRTAPDGRVVFDDADDPGIILIPRPWESTLPVGRTHRLLVSPLRSVFLTLKNEVGLSLPAVRYEARFSDGSSRSGRLGRAGVARLEGVPEGPFSVAYPDDVDILAKSMAASVRRAFDEQATAPLFTLLMQDRDVVERATAAYGQYFNDLTGNGLAADIDQVVTDPEARRPLLALCAMTGLETEGVEAVSIESFSEGLSIPAPPRST